jgi:hypothetical protein
MPCGVRQAVPCVTSLRLVGWTVPAGAACVRRHGYLGSGPPQLVLERLVFVRRRHLEQVQAV